MARLYEGTNIADLPEGEELHEDLNACDDCGIIGHSESEMRWKGYADGPIGYWEYVAQQQTNIDALCDDCYEYYLAKVKTERK